MRLTIGNLFIAGRKDRGTERSADILARKSGELTPPYAGRRVAAGAEYRAGVMREARRMYCLARAPRRRIRLVTVVGDWRFCETRLSLQNLCRLGTSNGCRNHTLWPYAAARLRQPPSSEAGPRRVEQAQPGFGAVRLPAMHRSRKPPCDQLRRRCRVHRIPRIRDDRERPSLGTG